MRDRVILEGVGDPFSLGVYTVVTIYLPANIETLTIHSPD